MAQWLIVQLKCLELDNVCREDFKASRFWYELSMLSCWCFVILTGAVLHGVYIGCARFSNATGFRCGVGRIQNSTVWPSVCLAWRIGTGGFGTELCATIPRAAQY
eukprot:COSAG01_NODE_2261_length_8057_cov_38.489570_2_plen_105_part_00